MLIMLRNSSGYPIMQSRRRFQTVATLDRPGRGSRARQAVDRIRGRWADHQLRPVARDHRPLRHASARARARPERPRRAAVEQFHRASALLFRRDGRRRDHLHHPCRDEPQPARQYFCAAQAEARSVSGRIATRRSAGRHRGAAPAARTLGQAGTGDACSPNSRAARRARRPRRGPTTTPSSSLHPAPALGPRAWC